MSREYRLPPTKNKRKAVDEGGLDSTTRATLNRGSAKEREITNQGTFGEKRVEAVPNFIQTESEKVIAGQNNQWIVMGRDRPGNIASGYGGTGDTQAGSIDLVVGRMGYAPNSNAYVDPDFERDAARIYISQKTDIDHNFTIADGTVGNVKTKSGIGIKADGVRVIGREGIKLVTTTELRNSQNGPIESIGNIDFLAGNNNDKLEPLVKGAQLKKALQVLAKQLSDVTQTLNGFLTYQMAFNASVTGHTHQCAGPWGAPTAFPSVELKLAGMAASMNMGSKTAVSNVVGSINKEGWVFNTLNPMGEHYILSRNVNTT